MIENRDGLGLERVVHAMRRVEPQASLWEDVVKRHVAARVVEEWALLGLRLENTGSDGGASQLHLVDQRRGVRLWKAQARRDRAWTNRGSDNRLEVRAPELRSVRCAYARQSPHLEPPLDTRPVHAQHSGNFVHVEQLATKHGF